MRQWKAKQRLSGSVPAVAKTSFDRVSVMNKSLIQTREIIQHAPPRSDFV
jgi:hypothetical protein